MLQLPAHFTPTHKTDGLWGKGHPPWGHGKLDAIDCFAKGGTPVCCEFSGTVVKLSGHAPTPTTKPGGPYGWSIYIRNAQGTYFLTHFGSRAAGLKVGAKVKKGQVIGRVANYSKATGGVTPSHIHEGFHSGPWSP